MGIRVLITCGGTGGHINPALSIAEGILEVAPDAVVEFCGREEGLEGDLIPKKGYVFHSIRAAAFPSRPSRKMFRALSAFRMGRRMAAQVIRDFRPNVVVGTGGFVCGPLLSAAAKAGIPFVIHEQNALPGRANRLFSKKAAVVCTGFPGMETAFPKAKRVVYTGNPVRRSFFEAERESSRAVLDIACDVFFLLAIGGSLGSASINQAVLELGQRSFDGKVKIVLSGGKQQFKDIKENAEAGCVEVVEYIDDPAVYMAAADLCVCRSGALTCAEITAVGAASLMVPYPHAAGDHQTYNAKKLAKSGAGMILPDSELSADSLHELVGSLMCDGGKLAKIRAAAKDLATRDVAEQVAREIVALVK